MSAACVGPLSQIPPGEGRNFLVRGARIAVFRARTGGVYATQAECPHKRGPLADGLHGDGQLVCPLHGYKFELATGAAVGHACGSLATYAVSVDAAGNLSVEVP